MVKASNFHSHKFSTDILEIINSQKGSMAHYVPPNCPKDYIPPNYPTDCMPPNYAMDYRPPNQDHVPIQVVTHMPQSQIVYVDNPMPKDYVIWSVLSLIFCNPFCLGFVAFCYSIKSRDRKMAGDYLGAGSYGFTARRLNVLALLISLAALGVLISQIYTIIMLIHRIFENFN